MFIYVTLRVLLYCVCAVVLNTSVTGLLARSQYPEGPATGHFGTDFSWFPCVYKRMMKWFPRLQVATACFSCSPPHLKFLDPYFIFMYMNNNHCHQLTAHLQLNLLLLLLLSSSSSSSSSPSSSSSSYSPLKFLDNFFFWSCKQHQTY